jgi:hypothetical protein
LRHHDASLGLGRRVAIRALVAFIMAFVLLRALTAIIHFATRAPTRHLRIAMDWRMRTRLLHVVLIAVVLGVAACKVGDAATAGWTTVATFKGDDGSAHDTKPFTVHGRKVRLVYTVQPNSSGPVPFLVTLFREGTSGVKNELGRNACVSCDGQQTNELGTVPAGSYYLHVITSRPWTLTVEEAQ